MDLISIHVQTILDRNELKCIRNYFALVPVNCELKHVFSSFALIRFVKTDWDRSSTSGSHLGHENNTG
jgi:hypothetical protein